MADTRRSLSEVLALFGDNVTAQISPQDLRDFVISIQFNTVTEVNVAAYDLTADDYILDVKYTPTGAVAIDLKTAYLTKGKVLHIKDSGGNAGANNITITSEGAQTFDGAANVVISINYAAISLYCDGTNLFIF